MSTYSINHPAKYTVSNYFKPTNINTKRDTSFDNYEINQYFNKVHDVKIADNNLTITLKYKTSAIKEYNAAPQLRQLQEDIAKTIQVFTEHHKLGLQTEQALEVYIFNNQDDYKKYGTKSQYQFGNQDSGIYFYHDGSDGNPSKIFTYYEYNKPQNFKHELIHALVALTTNGKALPPILREGIAEYFQYLLDEQRNVQDFKITKILQKINSRELNLDLNTLLNTNDNTDNQDIIYGLGHVLVEYLYKKDAGTFARLLDSVKNENPNIIKEVVQSKLDSIYSPKDFQDYLTQNNIDSYMQEINVLKVEKSNPAGIIHDNNNNEIKFHQAVVKDSKGNTVASFSPVVHYYFNEVRVEYMAGGGRQGEDIPHYLGIPEEYTFLKLVSFKGQLKLTYCDKEGTPFIESQKFLEKIQKFQTHYQNHPEILAQVQEGLTYFDPASVVNISKKGQKGFMSYIKESQSPENLIFKVKGYDNPDLTARMLTIEHNGQAIGELGYTTGYFENDHFLYVDMAQQLHTSYPGNAYVALDKTASGHVRASFVEGRQVDSDAYYQEPHIHRNEVMENIHIQLNNPNQNVDSLLLKPTIKIYDHANSDLANSGRQTSSSTGFTVSKGELLDDRGTSATKDDIHRAYVVQNNEELYSFGNMGYYVTEQGDFFIHDHGKGIRFQLPKAITHLKLAHNEQGTFLIPTDEYGNENPESMPIISDEYKNISLRFANSVPKEQDTEYLPTSADLSKYRSGSLFTIKADTTDPRADLFKKVILLDAAGQSVATLFNEQHYCKGKFFISVDFPMYSQGKGFLITTDPKLKVGHDKNNAVLTFDHGPGDVPGVDRNYTAEKIIPISKNIPESKAFYDKILIEEEYDVHLTGA